MTTELQPRYDSRQSFYRKARVTESDAYYEAVGNHKCLTLTSYDTDVAVITIDGNNKIAKVFGTYSNTTLRHIKEFLLQNGFKAESKAQIEADYMKGDN